MNFLVSITQNFGRPWWLLLLLLLPVVAWLKGRRGVPPAFVYSSVQLVRALQQVSRSRAGARSRRDSGRLRWRIPNRS